MQEKKAIKISLSTLFLILAVIVIIIMAVFIIKLNSEKSAETEKSAQLQAQVNGLNGTVDNLQGKIDSISKTINSNNSSTPNSVSSTEKNNTVINQKNENKIVLEGNYYLEGSYGTDDWFYRFYSNGKVGLESNDEYKGTYTIEGNKVKIKFTEYLAHTQYDNIEDVIPETVNQNEELTIIDQNTLLKEGTGKYIKNLY